MLQDVFKYKDKNLKTGRDEEYAAATDVDAFSDSEDESDDGSSRTESDFEPEPETYEQRGDSYDEEEEEEQQQRGNDADEEESVGPVSSMFHEEESQVAIFQRFK